MSVVLNEEAYKFARDLIQDRKFVHDDWGKWGSHQPTTALKAQFFNTHCQKAYAIWHLGLDLEQREDSRARYRFLYGDFHVVHRCAVLTAEFRATQFRYEDIMRAANVLHAMIEEMHRLGRLHDTRSA